MSRHAALLILSASLLCSCSPQGAQISPDGEKVVIHGNNGTSTTTVNVSGGSAPYPVDFPISQYPGSKVTLSQNTALSSSTGTGGTSALMLETADSPEKVAPFYKDWFVKNGWTVQGEVNVSGMTNITAGKDGKTISVSTTGDGSKSMITISLQTAN